MAESIWQIAESIPGFDGLILESESKYQNQNQFLSESESKFGGQIGIKMMILQNQNNDSTESK